jgi:ABC-type transport system substrate-binding protein
MFQYKRDILMGATMALAVYVMLFSTVAPMMTSAYAQTTTSLFTVNLIAPSSNAVRRQHAAIITQSFQAVGINAVLTLVPKLADEIPRIFSDSVTQDFAHGGYDIAFIGWGATSPTPDSSFSNIRGDAADFSPNGNNYYLYNSSVVNSLINDLYSTPNQTRQFNDLWTIESTLLTDAPFDVIYYTNWIIARDPAIKDFGSQSAWNELAFPDVQHISGITTLNFAEASGIFPGSDLDPLPTSTSNQFYSLFVYGAQFEGLQEIDARNTQYYEALATSITSSADGLHWNITFQPNTRFQDGAPLTADDFVYTMWANFNPDSGSVGLGGMLSALGSVGTFKYLNGTSVKIDQSASAGYTIPFNITATSANSFSWDLGQFYPFMNMTYTAFSPLPMHFLSGFNLTQWESLPYSQGGVDKFANGSTVYLWDGSTTTTPLVGPFSNGPYYLKNYDFTANTASLVKWNSYWNATGLAALGQFTVTNYNVVYISGTDAAIAAYNQKAVNELDTNYGLSVNVNQLKGIGANVLSGPELGYQEFGVNNNNPIWGTGVATPNGKTDPTHAANYARDVRRAFSYLVPRQLIVTNLLLGAGSPGITPWSAAYGSWFNTNLQADPYDPNIAKAYLAAAGYNTGVSPIQTGGFGLGGITGASNVSITVGAGQIGNLTQGPVTLWGTPITLTGTFASPTTGEAYPNQLLFLDVSTDNVTFTTVGATTTSSTGAFSYYFIPPQAGLVYFRWNFTGYTVPAGQFGSTTTAGGYLALIANGSLPAVLPPQLSPVYTVNTVSLATLLNPVFTNAATHNDMVTLGANLQAALNNLTATLNANIATLNTNLATVQTNLQTSIASQIAPVQTGVTQLTSQYNTLNSNLGTVQYIAYGAILIAIIALLAAVFMSRRRA